MINRIVNNWTWIRTIYSIIGVVVIAQSSFEGQWMGVILGGWLTAMGIFSLGCAAGNCASGNCEVKPDKGHSQK